MNSKHTERCEELGVDLMKEKQEYIDALQRMEGAYYNFDGCMSSMNKFKEDINLLTGLVNDHFEKKQETNYEHYKDEILEDYTQNLAVVKGRPALCYKNNCNDCDFKINQIGCREKAKDWLNKPYEKPKYKLTQFEYDLLSVHKDYKTYNNIANQIHLFKMREKGYFKDVDTNIPIREILDNCEVIE